MSISAEAQKLPANGIIDLFALDTTVIGGNDIFRWCNYVNELGTDVIYNAQTYTRFPIDATGFERTGDAKQPRPKLRAANVSGLLGAALKELDDLIGAKLTRIRTFVKYIDAANFAAGNPLADPNVKFGDEVWFVDRKAAENGLIIEFELSSALDLSGVKLPRRKITQNTCPWIYRSPECGYTGGAVAKLDDTLTTDLNEDKCGKRVNSCQIRFGATNPLPFGGFVGVGK
ncbi:MAG: phage minor tail protein L [Gammaproteobacteria bacterium]|nr:phage minor tail protein L [Gammaproteobacteria bacterium]